MKASISRLPSQGKRAVLYLRQSKKRDDSESLANQEYLGREYCEKNGYEIVAVHTDVVTGRKWDTRPGVRATMSLIEDRHADVIVLWRWSRLSRNRLHWAVAADRVLIAGGRIESVTEPLDTSTAAGRFARGVMTEYAAFQSELIGEVWKETLERRTREGKSFNGRRRFGYIRNKEADTYSVDPETGPIVAELYNRAIAGTGQAALARWVNESGYRTPLGKMWHATHLKSFMDRGFAAGKIYFHGELLPGVHPAIIDEETFAAYQAKRANHVKGPRGTYRMASGLLECPCGAKLTTTSSAANGVATYGCPRRSRGDSGCEYRVSIVRHRVEERILEWMTELPAMTELLREAEMTASKRRIKSIEDRSAISRLITKVETRISSLTVKYVDDKISESAYRATIGPLENELATLRERYLRSAPMPQKNVFDHIPALVEGFKEADPVTQNQIARQLIGAIRINAPSGRGKDKGSDRIEIVPKWDTM